MEEMLNVDWDEKRRRLVDLIEPLLVAYLYVIAVIQPILGIILGIVAMTRCELEKNKRVGKIVLIISIVFTGVWVLCVVAYILLLVGMTTAGKFGKF